MNKVVRLSGVLLTVFVALFLVFAALSGFSFYVHPLFSECLALAEGMTQEEVWGKVGRFKDSEAYQVIDGGPGNYGWRNRLSYNRSILLVLEREPWYKLGQHPWQCVILFKDGLIVNVRAQFD